MPENPKVLCKTDYRSRIFDHTTFLCKTDRRSRIFDHTTFLCPQNYNLSALLRQDCERLHLMPSGLPGWFQRQGAQIDPSRLFCGEPKVKAFADARACYLRHLLDPSEVRLAAVAEVIKRPHKQSEVDDWLQVGHHITGLVMCREVSWHTNLHMRWTP